MRLLYAEDDKEALENTQFLLSEFFTTIETAVDGEIALKKYFDMNPDVIILDVNMPKLSGLEVMAAIRVHDSEIPIILVTAYSENDKLLEAIRQGVSSYIVKPYKMHEFEEAILKVTTKVRAYQELVKLTVTDSLTNILNRFSYEKKIETVINRAQRYDTYLSFIMLDIDYFKQYNDTYGHQAGDIVIQRIANVLVEHTQREDDDAFRLGGEEFGIICLGLNKEKSLSLAERIRVGIESLQIEHHGSLICEYITVSIGVFSAKGSQIIEKETIYFNTDMALYLAKNAGRNKIAFTDESL